MDRLHIVGCPRSGTTLALQLVVGGFDVDGYAPDEQSVFRSFREPEDRWRVFVSKNPMDIHVVGPILDLEPRFHVLYLLRDPRDVIVSRHGKAPDRYWTNLRMWRDCQASAAALHGHPRFLSIRYESLVLEPAETQRQIAEAFGFLKFMVPFAECFSRFQPAASCAPALHGWRPIRSQSVGKWRQHKARVLGQIRRHGCIAQELIDLGYEPDAAWLQELEGVEPDLRPSRWPESMSALSRSNRQLKRWLRVRALAVRRWRHRNDRAAA